MDTKIFSYAKFLMMERDMEAGYIQLIFSELEWTKDGGLDHLRARAWRAIVEYALKRLADRRAAAIATTKKICMGKSCEFVPYSYDYL